MYLKVKLIAYKLIFYKKTYVYVVGNGGLLIEMYQDWPFFRVTLDMIAMVIGKSSVRIQKLYENELVQDKELLEIGENLRDKFGKPA